MEFLSLGIDNYYTFQPRKSLRGAKVSLRRDVLKGDVEELYKPFATEHQPDEVYYAKARLTMSGKIVV